MWFVCSFGIRDVESILQVTSWMLLGYEKCIKVPESGLNEAICWHFLETHLKEDLSELVSDLVQRMQRTGILICSE
jgi:hypothetical protein